MALILVADDDETIREALYEFLSEEHRCQTAESAEEALALLEAEPYDLVLTDISMPGLSGLELLGHSRQKYPDTPVIIISGIADKAHAEGLIKIGAFDYLLKPFRLKSVERSVKRALEYRMDLLTKSQPDSTAGNEAAGDWEILT